jgi:hypothetical protein
VNIYLANQYYHNSECIQYLFYTYVIKSCRLRLPGRAAVREGVIPPPLAAAGGRVTVELVFMSPPLLHGVVSPAVPSGFPGRPWSSGGGEVIANAAKSVCRPDGPGSRSRGTLIAIFDCIDSDPCSCMRAFFHNSEGTVVEIQRLSDDSTDPICESVRIYLEKRPSIRGRRGDG